MSLLIAVLVAEGALRLFVTYALGHPRLMRVDPGLGWMPLPNLSITRRGRDGQPWTIRTGPCGLRGPCAFRSDAARRVLVLGDSFAFGEGVSVEERFDSIIARAHPSWSIVNTGVMGYGTDQELLASRRYVPDLVLGDAVLQVVDGADFYDIQCRRFSARPKPWFELTNGRIIEHPPSFGFLDRYRDRSYLATLIALSPMSRPMVCSDDVMARAVVLFERMIVREADAWIREGLRVVAAWHGADVLTADRPPAVAEQLDEVQRRLCSRAGWRCVMLAGVLGSSANPRYFLADEQHWNANGHAVVGQLLNDALHEE